MEKASEIVCVFTWQRDPLLYLCLEAIRSQAPNILITVFSDRGHRTPELDQACEKFNATRIVNTEPRGYGNSNNVLMGMDCGADVADLVHCIEDDTILHPGYLEWARKILSTRIYACALGRVPGDPLSTWYASPCVSWNSDFLRIALNLVPPNYLRAASRYEMQKIVDWAFPKSRYKFGSGEQDGFFLRVMEFKQWRTAYPDHDFASHVGTWGYNQGYDHKPMGTFEQQIQHCRELLHSKERRTERFGQRITEKEMDGMKITGANFLTVK